MTNQFENPLSPEAVHAMRAHVANLAKKHDIKVCYHHELFGGSADSSERMIHVSPINGPISYFVSLHELGHLATGTGGDYRYNYGTLWYKMTNLKTPWDNELLILEELEASQWAFDTALFWNS